MKTRSLPPTAVEGIHYTRGPAGEIFPIVRGGAVDTFDELEAKALGFVKDAEEVAAKAARERGEDAALTEDEMAQVLDLTAKGRDAMRQAKALKGVGDARAEFDSVFGGARPTGPGVTPGKGLTLGEKFTSADEFRSWLDGFGPSIATSKGRVGDSPRVSFGMKDLVTGASDTSAGALVNADRLGLLDGLAQFQRPLTLVDLITRGTTGSDTVEYARVTGFTNNAAPVPEATSAAVIGDGEGEVTATAGGLKPESGLALQKVTATVKTIAHFMPATKRSLSDAGQIRSLIDAFLRYGLDEETEDQVLLGDGEDENLPGILETSGIQGQAWDTDLLTTTRKARTLVRTVGRARPTAFVFHPNDNERIDLLKNSNGDFYFGGPTSNPSAPLWGLPRVECEAMPEGTGMVADWRMAVLWDREESTISVSDSHNDFFRRNLVAILAELRCAFGVIRPKAFVQIDLTAGS